jgi:copper chaperone CopZ
MKNKILNLIMTVAAVILLSVLALYVRVGATADAVAVLRATGMTCSSCSDQITRALESLRGVAVTEVDVANGWVVVGYDSKAVRPEALAEKVSSTGFGSSLQAVMTPERYQQMTGRDIGRKASVSGGCGGCGAGGGCGSKKQG